MLDDFDEGSSKMKDMGGSLMGNLAALGHSIAGDEIIKNLR